MPLSYEISKPFLNCRSLVTLCLISSAYNVNFEYFFVKYVRRKKRTFNNHLGKNCSRRKNKRWKGFISQEYFSGNFLNVFLNIKLLHKRVSSII